MSTPSAYPILAPWYHRLEGLMYPTFCSFRADLAPEDPHFAAMAEIFKLGDYRPGLALAEVEGQVEVLVAPDGRTAQLPVAAVRRGLSEDAAMAMMDAVEEAIEDARAAPDLDST